MDLSDDPASKRLIELSQEIDLWLRRMEDTPPKTPRLSAMSGDDRVSAPFQLSHAVWMALSHATDSLSAFRALTVQGGPEHFEITTRPYGAYPGLRAGLENAAAAIWMLGPTSRKERVSRRFAWYLTDGKHRDQIHELLGSPATSYSARLDDIRPLVAAQGIGITSVTKMPSSFSRIVATAGDHVQFGAVRAELIWRLLSGMTHGDMWASLSFTDLEQISETADAQTMRITTSVDKIALLAQIACLFLRQAYALYDLRVTPYPELRL